MQATIHETAPHGNMLRCALFDLRRAPGPQARVPANLRTWFVLPAQRCDDEIERRKRREKGVSKGREEKKHIAGSREGGGG